MRSLSRKPSRSLPRSGSRVGEHNGLVRQLSRHYLCVGGEKDFRFSPSPLSVASVGQTGKAVTTRPHP